MRLSRWFLLIGAMVGVGCFQVAQRNAVLFKGYAVGQRLQMVHEQEAELAWLQSRVIGLVSPSSLSRVTRQQQMTLVAWSMMPRSDVAQTLDANSPEEQRSGDHAQAVRVAAASSAESSAAGE